MAIPRIVFYLVLPLLALKTIHLQCIYKIKLAYEKQVRNRYEKYIASRVAGVWSTLPETSHVRGKRTTNSPVSLLVTREEGGACGDSLGRNKASTVTSINWIIKRRNSKEKGKKDKVMPFKETGKEVLWGFSAQDDTGRWRIRQGNICHPLWPCKSPAENPDSQGRVSEDKNTSYHVGVRSPIPGHHAKWLIHTISSNSHPALQRIIISPYGPGNGFREQLEFS